MTQNLPSYKKLEAVPNEHVGTNYEIQIKIPEFNCVCPRSGLPDFGCIYINYIPNKHIVELKSLKLYIVDFRLCGIFHEDVTNKIRNDFKRVCKPKKITVIGDFKPRGGIKTKVVCNDDSI